MIENKKICVIGAGKWGSNHIRTLDCLNSLGGVVDSSFDNINIIKKTYPGIKTFSDINDSFNEKYDGYVIASPASTHYSIAKKLINKGFSILIEKPMTLNSRDAENLVQLSNKKNVNIMVGHLLLFHPAIIKIKELIDLNKIGKLQYIYSNRLNLGQIRTEENVFWSLAPHDISILQYLTNSYPIDIECSGATFVQDKIQDTTITTLTYPNNIKSHIYLSWIHPFKEHRLVVIGSKGMLSFEDSTTDKEIIFYNKKFVLNGSIPEKQDGESEVIKYKKAQPLEEELKYFITHLDYKKNLKSNVKNGYDIIKILEIASESLNKKEYSL